VWIIDVAYSLPALISILSYRRYVTGLMTLVVCGKWRADVEGVIRGLIPELEILRFRPATQTWDGSIRATVANRLARMYVAGKWPEELVLHIDADTLMTEAAVLLVRELEDHCCSTADREPAVFGVPEFSAVLEGSRWYLGVPPGAARIDSTWEDERDGYFARIYGARWREVLGAPLYNNGVLAFRNCRRVAGLWKTYYLRGGDYPTINLHDDQTPLSAAVQLSGSAFHLLDRRFNSMGLVDGDYAIYHPWAGRWRAELHKARAGAVELSDYARLARSYLSQVPAAVVRTSGLGDPEPGGHASRRRAQPGSSAVRAVS
jgi:hypothetical protein